MNRKKISVPKRVKDQIDKYPMVVVEWYDIVSNSSWSSFDECSNDVIEGYFSFTCY